MNLQVRAYDTQVRKLVAHCTIIKISIYHYHNSFVCICYTDDLRFQSKCCCYNTCRIMIYIIDILIVYYMIQCWWNCLLLFYFPHNEASLELHKNRRHTKSMFFNTLTWTKSHAGIQLDGKHIVYKKKMLYKYNKIQRASRTLLFWSSLLLKIGTRFK